MHPKDRASEPHGWPAFTVLSFDGEAIDAGDDLDDLLEALDAAIDGRHGQEELAVWEEGERIVAVQKADGRIIRLDGPQPEELVLSERAGRRLRVARRTRQDRARGARGATNGQAHPEDEDNAQDEGEAS